MEFMNATNMLMICNKGQLIESTNYFDSENADRGLLYLSWNAGAGRLLVPDSLLSAVREMRDSQYVVVSRGPWVEMNSVPALELLFEDNSNSPFSLILSAGQTNRMLPSRDQGGGFYISVWTRTGMKFRHPGRYREVTHLPCLEEWAAEKPA